MSLLWLWNYTLLRLHGLPSEETAWFLATACDQLSQYYVFQWTRKDMLKSSPSQPTTISPPKRQQTLPVSRALEVKGFPVGTEVVKNPPANAGDRGWIPGSGGSSGGREWQPTPSIHLENSWGASRAPVQTWVSHEHTHWRRKEGKAGREEKKGGERLEAASDGPAMYQNQLPALSHNWPWV